MKILIWIKINSRSHELSIFFNNVLPFFADLSVRHKNNKPWILTWGPVTQYQLLYSTFKNCIYHENHAPLPEQTLKEARHGESEQAKSPTFRSKKDS